MNGAHHAQGKSGSSGIMLMRRKQFLDRPALIEIVCRPAKKMGIQGRTESLTPVGLEPAQLRYAAMLIHGKKTKK
jgi:hypothetical protein